MNSYKDGFVVLEQLKKDQKETISILNKPLNSEKLLKISFDKNLLCQKEFHQMSPQCQQELERLSKSRIIGLIKMDVLKKENGKVVVTSPYINKHDKLSTKIKQFKEENDYLIVCCQLSILLGELSAKQFNAFTISCEKIYIIEQVAHLQAIDYEISLPATTALFSKYLNFVYQNFQSIYQVIYQKKSFDEITLTLFEALGMKYKSKKSPDSRYLNQFLYLYDFKRIKKVASGNSLVYEISVPRFMQKFGVPEKNLILKSLDTDKFKNPNNLKEIQKWIGREIEILETINNQEGVSQMYGYCNVAGQIYTVSEKYDSDMQNLFNYLAENPKVLTNQIVYLISHYLVSGLQVLHEKFNIAHRDLKPQNVFISNCSNFEDLKNIKIFIADFDRSKQLVPNIKVTQIMGLEGYNAPELEFGSQNINAKKCDIFSMGIILYQFANRGKHPGQSFFLDKTNKKKMFYQNQFKEEAIKQQLKSFDFQEDFIKFLSYCLEFNPEKRFTTEQAYNFSSSKIFSLYEKKLKQSRIKILTEPDGRTQQQLMRNRIKSISIFEPLKPSADQIQQTFNKSPDAKQQYQQISSLPIQVQQQQHQPLNYIDTPSATKTSFFGQPQRQNPNQTQIKPESQAVNNNNQQQFQQQYQNITHNQQSQTPKINQPQNQFNNINQPQSQQQLYKIDQYSFNRTSICANRKN